MHHDRTNETLELFRMMKRHENSNSNKFAVSSALPTTIVVPYLRIGKEIHVYIIRKGFGASSLLICMVNVGAKRKHNPCSFHGLHYCWVCTKPVKDNHINIKPNKVLLQFVIADICHWDDICVLSLCYRLNVHGRRINFNVFTNLHMVSSKVWQK